MKLDKISPHSLSVWKIQSIAGIFISLFLALLVYFILPIFTQNILVLIIIISILILSVAYQVIEIIILSKMRYNSWYFSINEEMVIIKKGIVIKKTIYIPVSRIQHVNTSQGPVMERYDLREITINTAGGSHSIPCIEGEKALLIQETIADFAERSNEENGL